MMRPHPPATAGAAHWLRQGALPPPGPPAGPPANSVSNGRESWPRSHWPQVDQAGVAGWQEPTRVQASVPPRPAPAPPDPASWRPSTPPAAGLTTRLLADGYFRMRHHDRTGDLRLHEAIAGLGLASALTGELIWQDKVTLEDGMPVCCDPSLPSGTLVHRVFGSTTSSSHAIQPVPAPDARLAGRLDVLLALIGPPAAGKTTVSADLVHRLGATVFRLREFAIHCRAERLFSDEAFSTHDELGWFSDTLVDALLRAAFLHGHFPATSVVILENFPGTAEQLHLLDSVARIRGAQIGVIELAAPDQILHVRARRRRVCVTCEPDPLGDPHRPAIASAAKPTACRECGDALVRRRSDQPAILAARLQRYRQRSAAIRDSATALGLPYVRINATAEPAATVAAAAQVAAALGAPPPSAPPHEGER